MFSKITALALLFTTTIAAPMMASKQTITQHPSQVVINGSCFGGKCNATHTTMTHTNMTHTTMTHTNITNYSCYTCMVLTSIIKGEMDLLNNTISNITYLLKELCSEEPPCIAKECEYVVDSIQHITALVNKNVNVTQICRDIGMCNLTNQYSNVMVK